MSGERKLPVLPRTCCCWCDTDGEDFLLAWQRAWESAVEDFVGAAQRLAHAIRLGDGERNEVGSAACHVRSYDKADGKLI